MRSIAVTGHMDLTARTGELVGDAIREVLRPYLAGGVRGLSCLAPGADTIFAEAVLGLGGELHVVLPAADYRDRKVDPVHAHRFDQLIRQASGVQVMPYPRSNRNAYAAANEALLSSCDLLLAVWDGHPPADRGGTAAVVESARSRGVPVQVVWPAGAEREQRPPQRSKA